MPDPDISQENAALLAWRDAEHRLDDLKKKRQAEHKAAVIALEQDLEAKYGQEIREAEHARSDAWRAVEVARVEAARTAERPIPIGTVMEEWRVPGCGWYHRREQERTGRRGVLQLVEVDTEFPRGRFASVGSECIRVFRKNGQLGKMLITRDYEVRNNWRPVTPEGEVSHGE